MEISTEVLAKCVVFLGIFVCNLSLAHAGINSIEVTEVHAGEFDVKPGGSVHEFEQSWEGVTCKFTYACQGGTKEQWLMKLLKSANGREFKCSIERPGQQPSYLFFQKFNVKVAGGTIQEGAGEGEPGKSLKPEEYAIDSGSNSLGHVEGKFEAHLNKIEVYFTTGKREL